MVMSDLKVLKLEPRSTVQADTVKAIEDLLERARSGELQSLYAACLLENGDIATVFSLHGETFKAAGAIEYLKKRVLEEI